MQTEKQCTTCGEIKPLSEFPQKKKESIKLLKRNHNSYCKACNAERARVFRKNNPGYKTSGKVVSLPIGERPWMSAVRQRLTDAKGRCKKLGRTAPVLTDTYLYKLLVEQDKKCALTGANLRLEPNHPLCLSLDQKDPTKGYVEGNVQWLAWCVNRAKGDLAMHDFYDMCEIVIQNRKVQRLSLKGSTAK